MGLVERSGPLNLIYHTLNFFLIWIAYSRSLVLSGSTSLVESFSYEEKLF